MSNELTTTSDTQILNFADPYRPISKSDIPVETACIDALTLAKGAGAINESVVVQAIKSLFCGGDHGITDIIGCMQAIVPQHINAEFGWDSLSDEEKSGMLNMRQTAYFQRLGTMDLNTKSAGYDSFSRATDDDIERKMEAYGVGKDAVLLRLSKMLESEDDVIAMKAIDTITKISSIGHAASIHADRKKVDHRAKTKIATALASRSVKSDKIDKFAAAAAQAQKMRNAKTTKSEVVE